MHELLDARYWQERWEGGYTGWDLGHVSRPLRQIIDGLEDRQVRILVPGAGNGFEVEYLHQQGFSRAHILDWADAPLQRFRHRNPSIGDDLIIHDDFFEIQGGFDVILEQTFFCALAPERRQDYVVKMHQLLVPGGCLTGVLFNVPLNNDRPPFGGNQALYRSLFEPHFDIKLLEPCTFSEPDRMGMELVFRFQRKDRMD